MHYTMLGRTGLKVGVAGLGCGGNSRLGLGRGRSEDDAVALVHRALDLGVNLIDTAADYGTEAVVGRAIRGRSRDTVVISTKARPYRDGAPVPAAEIAASLDASLRRLGLAHVDIFHLHGVRPQDYARMRDDYLPVLEAARAQGKFRFLGITESPPADPVQAMLSQALRDDRWDVMMIGFHMLNQTPRSRVLPATVAKGIGTLMMFAVRNIFSVPGRLQAEIARLVAAGALPATFADDPDPLGFLVGPGGAESLVDAAYRYVRHEPGCDVVLFGTGDPAHLAANVASILRPPLPSADRARLARDFGALEGVGLDVPDRATRPAAG
jgi:aryl-alcohol dehydrogenase-like predicted oxidoreductase